MTRAIRAATDALKSQWVVGIYPIRPFEAADIAVRAARQAIRDEAAAEVKAMCHWKQLDALHPGKVTGHRAFHFGFTCPYEAMAAVLRGQPDPRDSDRPSVQGDT